jgi:hypothetical protein
MARQYTHNHLLFRATTTHQKCLSLASSAATNEMGMYSQYTTRHVTRVIRDHQSTPSIRQGHISVQLRLKDPRHQKRRTIAIQQTYHYHARTAITWTQKSND